MGGPVNSGPRHRPSKPLASSYTGISIATPVDLPVFFFFFFFLFFSFFLRLAGIEPVTSAAHTQSSGESRKVGAYPSTMYVVLTVYRVQ
jgi:hypothetical protein